MLSKALMAAAGTTEEIQFSDDVFSTYLYTGTGTTQTINNGIDLAGKGGMVWTKARTGAIAGVISHTARSMTFGATGEM